MVVLAGMNSRFASNGTSDNSRWLSSRAKAPVPAQDTAASKTPSKWPMGR